MKYVLRRILFFSFLFTMFLGCDSSKDHRTQKLEINLIWYDNLDTALENARWANKPVLIVFTTPWCSACTSLKKHTFTNPETTLILQKLILVELDIEDKTNGVDNRKWMEKLCSKPGWIPITVVITPGENILGEIIGSTNYYTFNKFLHIALSEWDKG